MLVDPVPPTWGIDDGLKVTFVGPGKAIGAGGKELLKATG
jgi:hypothetical protein